jgi:hypothetical protein
VHVALQFWLRHGRAIGALVAVGIIAGALWVVAAQWYGTLRLSALKVADGLGAAIRTELGLAGIAVEANLPKAGDVSVRGTVPSQAEHDALLALVERWRSGAEPSEIRVDVRTGDNGPGDGRGQRRQP